MISIQLKTIQKQYEFIDGNGVVTLETVDVNYPVEEIPLGVRIMIDGSTGEISIAESKVDEAKLITDYPALKETTDKQKPVVVDGEIIE